MTKEETYSIKYFSRAGLVILILFTILLSFAYYNGEPKVVYIPDPNYVQSPFEAQQILKDMGLYHGKIDGIWGKESDKAYCDYRAIRAVEGE